MDDPGLSREESDTAVEEVVNSVVSEVAHSDAIVPLDSPSFSSSSFSVETAGSSENVTDHEQVSSFTGTYQTPSRTLLLRLRRGRDVLPKTSSRRSRHRLPRRLRRSALLLAERERPLKTITKRWANVLL